MTTTLRVIVPPPGLLVVLVFVEVEVAVWEVLLVLADVVGSGSVVRATGGRLGGGGRRSGVVVRVIWDYLVAEGELLGGFADELAENWTHRRSRVLHRIDGAVLIELVPLVALLSGALEEATLSAWWHTR